MMWTFDPLESRNGYFNFHKLMTTSSTYRADYYGPMRDALNKGFHPTAWSSSGISVVPGNRSALHILLRPF